MYLCILHAVPLFTTSGAMYSLFLLSDMFPSMVPNAVVMLECDPNIETSSLSYSNG